MAIKSLGPVLLGGRPLPPADRRLGRAARPGPARRARRDQHVRRRSGARDRCARASAWSRPRSRSGCRAPGPPRDRAGGRHDGARPRPRRLIPSARHDALPRPRPHGRSAAARAPERDHRRRRRRRRRDHPDRGRRAAPSRRRPRPDRASPSIVPHAGIGAEPVFAGCHRLNGNGELTGLDGSASRVSSRPRSRSRTPTASASCATRSSPPRCAAGPTRRVLEPARSSARPTTAR